MTSDHHFLASAVDVHRQQGYQITDDGYSCDGEKNVSEGQYYGICLDNELSGHFYESEVLLEKGETGSDDKACSKAGKGYHPSFQDEDAVSKYSRPEEMSRNSTVFLEFSVSVYILLVIIKLSSSKKPMTTEASVAISPRSP